jgi:hypothetical protein
MNKLFISIVLLLLLGCNRDDTVKKTGRESEIVVEGWIEEGDVAQVILSRSVPINTTIDTINGINYVIRSAKVTLSDGINEEILRLRTNNNHIPPFVYYGSDIIGKAGKQYTLRIEYLGKKLEATTSIPNSVPFESASYVKNHPSDRNGFAFIKFKDPVNEKNYYQIETRLVNHDSLFIPALYGNLSDENFTSSDVSIQIYRGKSFNEDSEYKPYFEDGNKIYIKLRTMNKIGFDFWNSWQNEILNGQSPIFPNTTSLKSNITGGLGIWEGYGQQTILLKTTN